MFWSTLAATLLAQAAPILPSYEALAQRAGAGLTPPATCSTYGGHVYQVTDLYMIAKEATAFNFTGSLNHGVWDISSWSSPGGDNKTEVHVNEGELPFLPPSYGKMKSTTGTSPSLTIKVGNSSRGSSPPSHPTQPSPLKTSPAADAPPSSSGEPSLSVVEKVTIKLALHQALKEIRPELQAMGLEPDLVEKAIKAVLEQENPLELSDTQLESVVKTTLTRELAGRSPQELEQLTQVLLLAMRGELDTVDHAGTGSPTPPPTLTSGPAPTVQRIEENTPTGQSAVSPPSDNTIKIENMFEAVMVLLELPEEQVEMRSVEVGALNGRTVYVMRRVVDLEDPWFGKPKMNAVTVWFDPFTLDPLRWQADLQLPTRLKGLSLPGKIRYFHLVIDLDALGRVTSEKLDVAYNLGPMGLEINRSIHYTWQGSCGK